MNGSSLPLKRKDLAAEIDRLQAELDRQADSQRMMMEYSVGNRAWLLALDRDGRIQFASSGLAEYLGFPTLDGMPWPGLVYPDDRQAAGDLLMRASGPQSGGPLSLRLLKMDGSPAMAELLPVPLTGAPGSPQTAAMFAVVLPAGQLEQNLQDISFVLERIGDAVIFTTLDLTIETWNQGAARLYGWTAAEAVGKNLDALLQTEYPGSLIDIPAEVLSKGSWVGEVIHRTRLGAALNIEAEIHLLKTGRSAAPQRLVNILHDVSQTRQNGKQLAAEHERLLLAEHAAHMGLWDWDIPTGQLTWSEEFYRVFGLPPGTPATFDTFEHLLHPDDLAGAMQRIQESVDRHIPLENEYRIITPAGDTRWIGAAGNVYYDPAGRPQRMIGFCSDISARKQVEQNLADSEQLYRSLFENMLNGFAYCRILYRDRKPVDFTYLAVNQAFENLTGLRNVTGRNVSEVIPGFMETDSQLLEIYSRVALGGEPERFEIYLQSLEMWFLVSVYSPAREYFVAIFDVITERKQAEQAMRISEEKFRQFFENASEAAFIISPDGSYLDMNAAAQNLLGYKKGELLGKSLNLILPPDGEDRVSAWLKTWGTNSRMPRRETRVHRKDGTIRRVLASAGAVRDDQGGLIYLAVLLTDITERITAEEALHDALEELKKNQSVLAEAQHLSRVGSWEWDIQGNRVEWSAELFRIFGFEPGSFVPGGFDKTPASLLQVIHPDDRQRFKEVMEDNIQRGIEAPLEYRVIHPDGSVHTIFAHGLLIKDEMGRPVRNLGFAQDITERKNIEKTLIETEKLAGIGTLAAGIAHEINTPLQIITGASETLRKKVMGSKAVSSAEIEHRLQNINENAWRISAIVRSLLDYARTSPGELAACSLNEIVRNTLMLTEHQFKSWSNIFIHSAYDEDLPAVYCDTNRITQVLLNLLSNARDAMPSGGNIHLATSFDARTGMAVLRVSDNGSGVPENIRESIFDPFYTTKPPGQGTGLGLSISAGIIHAHGGTLELEETSGAGSTFKLCLPIAAGG